MVDWTYLHQLGGQSSHLGLERLVLLLQSLQLSVSLSGLVVLTHTTQG